MSEIEHRCGLQMSGPGPALPPGISPQTAQDFRSAAINAGAGQTVYQDSV